MNGKESLAPLFNRWRDARDYLEEAPEEEFKVARAEVKRIEDEIFALTGRRPPYSTGFGGPVEAYLGD